MEDEMNSWTVTLPVTAIAVLEVEAETEEAAIEKALEEVTIDHLESWEAVEAINQGNVCYAMHPWDAEAVDNGPAQ